MVPSAKSTLSRLFPISLLLLAIGCGEYKMSHDSGGWLAGDDEGWGDPDDDDPADTADTADTSEDDCDEEMPVILFLSPDDSNSMSSPVQAREVVERDANLRGVAIRKWEFMNYYTFAYDPAPAGQLALNAALVEGGELGSYTLQIGLASEAMTDSERAPMNITLVLDTSGSMTGEPLRLLKATSRAIASSLKGGDVVSLVDWNTSNNVHLRSYAVTGPDDSVLLNIIDGLSANGGTDLSSGLEAGYDLAMSNWRDDRINRVVLISDGGANVGNTDEELIGRYAGSQDRDGVYMVGVGVGTAATYNDLLMDTVTDLGKGASVFIADEDEAEKMFHERFVNTMAVAARDVQMELDLPPGFQVTRFSGEQISTDPREVEPQHISPNDVMVFHQDLETCAPELVQEATEITITARYLDALTFQQHQMVETYTVAELLAQDPALLWKGKAIFSYAEGLKAWRDEGYVPALEQALGFVELAEGFNPGDADLAEIRWVLENLH